MNGLEGFHHPAPALRAEWALRRLRSPLRRQVNRRSELVALALPTSCRAHSNRKMGIETYGHTLVLEELDAHKYSRDVALRSD